jgi:hypothetical protein
MKNFIEIDFCVESLFEQDYKDAQVYHKRALQFRDAGQAFSLVFNVASVALERYLVALCELYGVEPMNHNFITLMMTVEKLLPIPKNLSNDIKSLDQIFGICFLENYYHGQPLPEDADKTLKMCDEIQLLFEQDKINNVYLLLNKNKTNVS